jgi:hypothetical protein
MFSTGRLYPRAVVPASTTLISQEEAALSFPWSFNFVAPYVSNSLQDTLSTNPAVSVGQYDVDTRPYLLERRQVDWVLREGRRRREGEAEKHKGR